jgi:hypothetical protein
VPADRLSTMLEGTPADFIRKWQGYKGAGPNAADGAAVQQRILAQICRSAHLLEMVGSGQAVDNPERDIQFVGNQTSLRPTAVARKFEWRWNSPDARSQWYFIPMEFLP